MTLQQYLDDAGLSQEAFAARLGYSQSSVSKWLNGAAPKRTTMVRIEQETGGLVPISAWFPAPPVTGDAAEPAPPLRAAS